MNAFIINSLNFLVFQFFGVRLIRFQRTIQPEGDRYFQNFLLDLNYEKQLLEANKPLAYEISYLFAYPILPFTGFGKIKLYPKRGLKFFKLFSIFKDVTKEEPLGPGRILDVFFYSKLDGHTKASAIESAKTSIKETFSSVGDTFLSTVEYQVVPTVSGGFRVAATVVIPDRFDTYSKLLQVLHERKMSGHYDYLKYVYGGTTRWRKEAERFSAKFVDSMEAAGIETGGTRGRSKSKAENRNAKVSARSKSGRNRRKRNGRSS